MSQKFYDVDQPEVVEKLFMPAETALVPLVAAVLFLVAFWELPKFLNEPIVAHVALAAR
jgi:hypothetical protein